MKNLNIFISERLKLDKDSKISGIIPTKFSDDILYTKEEIDIVQKYAEQLKVKPLVLTNYILIRYNNLHPFKNYICMYYDEGWEKYEKQNNYIYLLKDDEANNKWYAHIVINNHNYCLMNNGKTVSSLNVEDVCKELLQQLDKNDMFYNSVKNN